MKRQGMKIPHLQGPASRAMTTPLPNRAPVHPILHLQQRYDYKEDLGLCGWTFPASWYIEIGKDAFSTSKCCDLASTIAHEASHTELRTEAGARKLECNCFGCSC